MSLEHAPACEPEFDGGPSTWPRRSNADTSRYPGTEASAAPACRFPRAGCAARRSASAPHKYDNTQDEANHIDSVWRDLRRNFAGDLLAQHYAGVRH